MSPRVSANTVSAPEPEQHESSSRATIDTAPEREGYLAARWVRTGDAEHEDWTADGDMTRARLVRRYRRFIGQVAPSAGRCD